MDSATLEKLIVFADKHQAADEYQAGYYAWYGGACAIGCTIRDAKTIGILPKTVDSGSHSQLASATNVPEVAWRLCDAVFEGLPDADCTSWTPRFLRAVRPNADYALLPARLAARVAEKLGVDAPTGETRKVNTDVAALWRRRIAGDEPTQEAWSAAESAARSAAESAARETFWRWCADMVCEELQRN